MEVIRVSITFRYICIFIENMFKATDSLRFLSILEKPSRSKKL